MIEASNTLDDFPAETFTIFAYCDTCDCSTSLDRAKVPDGMTIQQLLKALRCSPSSSRGASIRIVTPGPAASRTATNTYLPHLHCDTVARGWRQALPCLELPEIGWTTNAAESSSQR